MADPRTEGVGRTFPGNPNPPAAAPEPSPTPPAAEPTGEAAGAPTPAAAEPTRPVTPRATFRVTSDGTGRRVVYMMDDKLNTTRLGPVSIDDADDLLAQVGQFNETTKSWRVPEDAARQLLSGDLPLPDYIPAKYRANKALIARGLIMTDWMRGEVELEDAMGRAELETLKMQVKEAPLFVWRGNLTKSAAGFWKDMKELGPGGVARRAAGETAGIAAFVTDAPFLGAAGMTAGAAIVGTKGLAAPAVAAGLATALNTGAGALIFKRAYEIEGGNAAAEMIEKGFEPETVKRFAPLVGVMNGALEVVSFRLLAAPFKRVMLRQVIATEGVKKTLASAYTNYMKELGLEVTQEEAQEAVNLMAEAMAAEAEQRPELRPTGEEAINQLVNVGLQAALGTAGIKVPGLALEARAQRVAAREAAATAEATGARIEAFEKREAEAAPAPAPEAPEAPAPAEAVETAVDEFIEEGQEFGDGKAEAVVEAATEVVDEEVAAQEAAILEELDRPPEKPGLEAKTREVEAKGRVKALETELEGLKTRIREQSSIRQRLARRGESTALLDRRVNRLLDQAQEVQEQIDFFREAGRRAAVTAGEVLQVTPATLENIIVEGFKEGRAEIKGELKERAQTIKGIAEKHKFTAADMKQIMGNRNIGALGAQAFQNFLKGLNERAVKLADRKDAERELKTVQKDRDLKREQNLRRIYGFPTLRKMTTEQIREYAKNLSEFDQGETVLTPKQARSLERTEFRGVKTYEQLLRRAAEKFDGKVKDLDKVEVGEFTRGYYDTLLAGKHPMFDVIVRHTKVAQLKGERFKEAFREMNRALAAEAIASRRKLLRPGERLADVLAPQQAALFDFMEEQNAEKKAKLAGALTPQELEYAQFLDQAFRGAYTHLVKIGALKSSRFVGAYVFHRGRELLEVLRDLPDEGVAKTLTDLAKTFDQKFEQISAVDANGNALSYQKFFKQTFFRTGELVPSRNIVKSSEIYFDSFFDKVALDEAVPTIMTLAHALVVLNKTPEAKQQHDAVIAFVKDYLNAKKGNAQWYVQRGGIMEALIRTGSSFSALAYIALNLPLQIASPVGEFAAEYVALGARKIALAKKRKLTAKGKRILEKHKAFIGESFAEQFFAPGKSFSDRIGLIFYGSFRANRQRTLEDLILGNMTEQEFEAETISDEKLATVKLIAGRWIDVHGAKSIRGATVEGAGFTQFKGWAIPPLVTTGRLMGAMADKMASGKKLTPQEFAEMYRLAMIGSVSLFLAAHAAADKDDDSFAGRTIRYALREIGSPFQALLSFTALSAGVWIDLYRRLAKNLLLIGNLMNPLIEAEEREKKTKRGTKGLRRMFTPAAVKPFLKDEED